MAGTISGASSTTAIPGGPQTSFTGLASGIDTGALVESIIRAAKAPAVLWQGQITGNTARRAALDTLAQDLNALSAAANALKYGAGFNNYAVTATGADASGRAVLGAAATSTASAGTHALSVQQLAQAQTTVGSAQASSSAAMGFTGGLTLTNAAGASVTVAVASGDSLATLRNNVNAVQGQSGVQASIVAMNADGSGAHLVLSSLATGTKGGFTVADAAGTSPSITAGLGLGAPSMVARDAQLTVDGVAVTRPSNTVTDALAGVTMTLGAIGNSTLTLTRQSDQAQAAVKAFADAYNTVHAFVQTQNTAGADGTFGPLHNDPAVRDARTQLANITLTSGAAANGVAPDLATLASAGLSLQQDGTLTLDAPTFQTAFQSRQAVLSSLFTDRMGAVTSYVDTTATPLIGTIALRESGINIQNAHLQARVDALNSREDKRRIALLSQYAKFEAALSQIQATGTSLTAQLASLTAKSGP